MTLISIPVSLAQANSFVGRHHRHHAPVRFHKYSIGVAKDVTLVGVCIVLRMDNGLTLEVARLCTDGTPNVCSSLLSRAARAAAALGYERIQTYTIAEEVMKSRGASLWAAGWLYSHTSRGGTWKNRARSRRDKHPAREKFCWVKFLKD